MSFQPQGPLIGLQPPSAAPPPPEVTPPAKSGRRTGSIVLGVLLLIGGLVGGGAVLAKSTSNYEDSVKSLARAPVGCTTTLVFDKAATYTLYAETKGTLGQLSGDCEAKPGAYSHAGDKRPKLSTTLVNSNGDEVSIQSATSASYDAAGYVGTAVGSVRIASAGTYRLDVRSDDTDFAVAIGKNPKADRDRLGAIGLGVAAAGLVLGLIFILLGLRRRRPEVAVAEIGQPGASMPGWPPGPYARTPPQSPPVPPVPAAPARPGFLPQPPPIPGRDQPPIRVPDRLPGTGFAPPSPTAPIPPGMRIPPPPATRPTTPVPPAPPGTDDEPSPDGDSG